jgi:hypothetical protein
MTIAMTPLEREIYRRLRPESGEPYLDATQGDAPDNVMFRLAPESWRTADFTKQ